MKYIEVKITTSETGIEPVSAALMGIGINDVEIDDPEEILGMIAAPAATEWYDETQIPEVERKAPSVKVYMDADDAGRAKAEEIRGAMERLRENLAGLMNLGSLTVETSVNDDAEWKDRWKEYFVPTRVSERIVVKPTWREYQRTGDELVIEIDPGMAFGTGTHETTSLSLRMLEKYVTPASRVLDVGTGSGILAIAAVLLGAEDVLGIDIDEDAVRVANENLALNGTADKARAIRGDLTAGVDYKADIVVANLLADLVMRLSPDAGRHLEKGGIYITSGILTTKKEQVAEVVKQSGFDILEVLEDGEWCSIVGRKL